MSSFSLGQKNWDSTWYGLPKELRLLILDALIQDGCRLGHLATVCREWQNEIEQHIFARIRLTASRLVDFASTIHRRKALVHYIWLCLELDEYDCTECAPCATNEGESLLIDDTDRCPITGSFQLLFSALSVWEPNGELILDISVYSPSDSEHWFKYATILPNNPYGNTLHQGTGLRIRDEGPDDVHRGWIQGTRDSAPVGEAITKVFFEIMSDEPFHTEKQEREWWDRLPEVSAVTCVLLRQQTYRRWKPISLGHMLARLTELQELHYEPWREWDYMQRFTDECKYLLQAAADNFPSFCLPCRRKLTVHVLQTAYSVLFDSIGSNNKLKKLVVFENFNQQFPPIVNERLSTRQCEDFRTPDPAVSQMIARTSINLEQLSASYIVDASHFFDLELPLRWDKLTWLVLTSNLLLPEESPADIGAMLQAAAAAALRMPKLLSMDIWNGRKRLAAAFQYRVFEESRHSTITFKGTWDVDIQEPVMDSWDAVALHHGRTLDFYEEWLDEREIKSHADAIHQLGLANQVIQGVSLQQIQLEQKALEGLPTCDGYFL